MTAPTTPEPEERRTCDALCRDVEADRDAAVHLAAERLLEAHAAQRERDKARADVAQLETDLGHWTSGRRRKGIPAVQSVPDGLHYAAELVRAQGTEGGEEHDQLLRDAGMRLKALTDASGSLLAEAVVLRADVAQLAADRDSLRKAGEELERQRDEAVALTATCSCGTSPMTYEGPEPDCAVHGAVLAFNLVTEELAQAHADMANAQSAHTKAIVDLAVKEMQACERAANAEEAARMLEAERDEARARANEAARLSAEARDQADDLRRLIADLREEIAAIDESRTDMTVIQLRLEAERDEANRLVDAHRAMTIDANKALRDVLLAALGVEDDGKTPLAAYVALVIAQRDEAQCAAEQWLEVAHSHEMKLAARTAVVEAAKAWRRHRNFEYRPGEINPHLLTAHQEDLDLAAALDQKESTDG